MNDKKMAANPDRAEEYKKYEKETPLVVPYTICCGRGSKNSDSDEKDRRVGSEDNNYEL